MNTHKDFDKSNRDIIKAFIEQGEQYQDDITGSALATIAQFIMNLRQTISSIARLRGENWISPEDIIDSQIAELRRCVVDLEAYKQRLIKGVTQQ